MKKMERVPPYTAGSFIKHRKILKEELNQLGLDISEVQANRLTFLSRRKYDRYDHFQPGETFYFRLMMWFERNFDRDERQIALEVVESLKFIDQYELKELVIETFENIKKYVLNNVIFKKNDNWYTYVENRNIKLCQELRKSIFIACADDIRFDYFRRYAMRTHPNEFMKDNFVEYYKRDKKSLDELPEFNRIFLIDQLSASGTTAIRQTESNWTGKIPRFLNIWSDFIDGAEIVYCPYVISNTAEKNISQRIKLYNNEKNFKNFYILPTSKIKVSKSISNSTGNKIDETRAVAKLCKKYYNKFKEDTHTQLVGEVPYGYGDAGLTLVFQSNCPNNSLPILWHSYADWDPLFPRISHHR